MASANVKVCDATPSCTAPVSNSRTRRCKRHQQEFEKFSLQYRQLKHRGKAPDITVEAFVQANYSESGDIYTWLSPDQRHALRNLIRASTDATLKLDILVQTLPSKTVSPLEAAQKINEFLAIHRKLTAQLNKIAKEPTD